MVIRIWHSVVHMLAMPLLGNWVCRLRVVPSTIWLIARHHRSLIWIGLLPMRIASRWNYASWLYLVGTSARCGNHIVPGRVARSRCNRRRINSRMWHSWFGSIVICWVGLRLWRRLVWLRVLIWNPFEVAVRHRSLGRNWPRQILPWTGIWMIVWPGLYRRGLSTRSKWWECWGYRRFLMISLPVHAWNIRLRTFGMGSHSRRSFWSCPICLAAVTVLKIARWCDHWSVVRLVKRSALKEWQTFCLWRKTFSPLSLHLRASKILNRWHIQMRIGQASLHIRQLARRSRRRWWFRDSSSTTLGFARSTRLYLRLLVHRVEITLFLQSDTIWTAVLWICRCWNTPNLSSPTMS